MPRMKPFFSIAIPVCNVAPYLRECLDSVLAQSFPEWEAVCVDDGSTDGSGAILDEYQARDPRFRVIRQANAGVSAARNVALDVASGEYVTFLDGDDVYDGDWLAEAHRVISKTGADLFRMRFKYFSTKLPEEGLSKEYTTYEGSAAVREWGYRTFAESGYSWLVFMKRDALLQNGMHEFPVGMKFMEDCIFMLRNVSAFGRAVQSEFAGYYYRIRSDSVTSSVLNIDFLSRLFQEYRSLVDDVGFEIVSKTSKLLQNAVLSWVKLGDRRSSRDADIRMALMVRQLVDGGYLDLRSVPARWRLGYEAVVRFRSFFVMDALFLPIRAWLRIRKTCISVRHYIGREHGRK